MSKVIQSGGGIREIQCGGDAMNVDDYRDGTLYSAADFAGNGAALPRQLQMFNYTQGQPVSRSNTMPRRTADARDTNMMRKNYMTNDQEILIAAMWPELFATTDDTDTGSGGGVIDAALLPLVSDLTVKWCHAFTILQLILGSGTNKPYMEGTFGYFPSATDALYTSCGDSPGGPEVALGSLGLAGGQMARVADRYVHVDSAQRLEVRILFPAGGTPYPAEGAGASLTPALVLPQSVTLRVNLRGLRKFPVQGGSAA